MKYVEPLNEPINSPYRNGNTDNGEQGSIIPAQAIEHPMREVMHVISQAHAQEKAKPITRIGDAIGEPDETDLTQLYQAIRKLCAPAGQIMAWGGSLENAPKGFLVCDGQAISRTDYADLFAILGILHGAGDDSSTFNLPDLRDRFVIGRSNTREVAVKGGSFTHRLTIAEMPSHNHHLTASTTGNFNTQRVSAGSNNSNGTPTTHSTGGGQPHSITNPYYALMYIIRT